MQRKKVERVEVRNIMQRVVNLAQENSITVMKSIVIRVSDVSVIRWSARVQRTVSSAQKQMVQALIVKKK